MSDKSGEELFIEGGEWKAPAVRGAAKKWINRDWTDSFGDRGSIKAKESSKKEAHAFKRFEMWLNRQIAEDWFKDIKDEYGNDEPRQIFYDYYHENKEFRKKVLSHIEGTDEWYEATGEEPDWDDDGDDQDGDGDVDKDQASFGESEFPELYDLGVIGDSGNTNIKALRGLCVAFAKDVDEIRGEERHFQIEWAQRAFLYWGKDRFGDEWMKLATRDANSHKLFKAIKFVYNKKDKVSGILHERYEGGHELGLGKDTTDDVLEAFLSAEVEDWGEDDDEGRKSPARRRWDRFEERSDKQSQDNNGQERSTEDCDGSGRMDSGNSDTGVHDSSGDSVDKWDQFEQQSEELEYEEPETEEDNDPEQDNQRVSDDSDSQHTSRGSGGDGGDDASSGGTLTDFAKEHGTTDEVNTNARARNGSSTSSSSQRRVTKTNTASTDASYLKRPSVSRMDELERNKIYRGNVYEWASKLPEDSVDTIVTSPPYYALRDYDVEDAVAVAGDFTCDHDFQDQKCSKCGAWMGQLGREDNPAQFIDHIVDLMERLRGVLKPTGSLWLNIGDTYAGKDIEGRVSANQKSRIMVPDRVYVRLVEEGWRLRNYVIWGKKIWMPDDDLRGNGKPFASGSRLADQWEPMVNFSPSGDHYSDVDSNRLRPPSFDGDLGKAAQDSKFREDEDTRRGRTYNPLGTNPSDVWLVNGDGRNVDHRAVFPEELPKRCINISTPDRVCAECGVPFVKEVHVEEDTVLSPGGDYATYEKQCNHDAGHEPGVVMDPFLGSGTTAIAAANNGFDWIGVELSDKYAEIARSEIPTGRQQGLDQFGD